MTIPKSITREHILQALDEIDRKGVPAQNKPTKFQLWHEGNSYPPKLVISLAYKFDPASRDKANPKGKIYPVNSFSGGGESNKFLQRRGFEIRAIGT